MLTGALGYNGTKDWIVELEAAGLKSDKIKIITIMKWPSNFI